MTASDSSQPHYTFQEDDNIDLKRYLSLFVSNWYWFVATVFLTFSLAYGINKYSEKVYTVSSTLLIRDDQIGKMNSNVESVIPGGDIFKRQQNLINEMGILRSLSLNYMAVKELEDFNITYVGVGRRGIVESRLYRSCPFVVKFDSLQNQSVGTRVDITILSEKEYSIEIGKYIDTIPFGRKFKSKGFDFIIEPRIPNTNLYQENNSNKFYFWIEDQENLANGLKSSISVTPIDKDASLVTLSISGYVPEQGADYLNKLMEVYINYGLEIKNETAGKTIKFIDDQLKIISDSLSKSEEKLERFRLANDFFNLSSEGTIFQNKLENVEKVKISFELQLQYYNYLSEYLDTKNTKESIISPTVMGITDQVLLRLVNELSLLQTEKEKLGYNIVVDQPVLGFVNSRISETQAALRENIRISISTLNRSIEEEEGKIIVIENEIKKLPTTERKLIGIQRNFDLNNTVYTYLLEKRAESGIAMASNVSDNRIIDHASQYSTNLIKPKTRMNLMIAIMLGLIIPMVFIFLIDFLNDLVIDKKDIEKKTRVPVIGYISHTDLKSGIPVIEKPGSSFAESFRSVRTAIKFFIKENEKPVIAITSTISSEGKTFISVNLAAIVAMLGKRVLLVGLDLRKPRINRVFKFEDSPGMSTYLNGDCEYDMVIRKTQIENLFYAPSGPIPPNPAELLERERMKLFIEKAKKEFDYIIIDTPPVAIVTDTMLLAPFVDLNLFIVRQRYTSRGTLEIVENLYQQGELKNIALILNDINLSGYYGYGIRYGYSLGYGYYYGHNYYGKGYYGRYGNSAKATSYYTEE
jgi:tyrosine-protein kinase Etk/Wzc